MKYIINFAAVLGGIILLSVAVASILGIVAVICACIANIVNHERNAALSWFVLLLPFAMFCVFCFFLKEAANDNNG